ncbi:phosphate signaling complex protein PhoU [Haloferula sp.]|uniref:phosphate signaling complex protein PhoU n=1 Tax=Haloferula sp. TaxID=2497595 RepID=UPI00329CC243
MNPDSPHIIGEFDDAIRFLRREVIAMAEQSRLNLERAVQGLLERDVDRCKAVVADDSDVDEMQQSIDSAGMDILLRFHPVASDLRLVISSMKIAANLERISDHAVNIAKRAKKMLRRPEMPEVKLTEPIYAVADKILCDSVTSYTDRNISLGASLVERDKELDRLHKKMIGTLSSQLEEGGERSEELLHLIFIARSFERVGDLAVNIGEDAVFLGSAQDIRHDKKLAAEVVSEGKADGNEGGDDD